MGRTTPQAPRSPSVCSRALCACILLPLLLACAAPLTNEPIEPPLPTDAATQPFAHDTLQEADRSSREGLRLRDADQPDEALAALDRAATLYEQAGAWWRAALLALPRAQLALAASDAPRALTLARGGASLLGDTGDIREVVALRLVEGLALAELGQRAEALQTLEHAAQLRRSLGTAAPLAETDLLLAELALALHRNRLAAEATDRVASAPLPDLATEARLHLGRARLHRQRGELAAALSEHGRALSLQRARKNLAGAMRDLLALASLFLDLGKLDVAWAVASRAEGMAFDRGPEAILAHARTLLGRIAEELGDRQEARQRYLAVQDAAATHPIDADDLAWAQAGAWRLCHLPPCESASTTFAASADASGAPSAASETRLLAAALVARELVERGERDEAALLLQRVEGAMTRPLAPSVAWRIHYVLGLAYRELGHAEPARRHLELAAFGLEALRLHIDTSALRRSVLQDRRDVFEALVDAWVGRAGVWPSREDARRALVAAERTHSRELLELLLERRDPDTAGLRPAALDVQHQRLAQQLVDELALSPDAAPQPTTDAFWDDVGRIAHLAELWSGMRESGAPATSPGMSFAFERVPDDLQRELTDGEALLSYLVGPGRSYVWVVRREGIDLVPLVGLEQLQPALDRYQASLLQTRFSTSEAFREHVEAGRALTALLLDPILGRLRDIDRVVVATDGPLHGLPFSTLIGPDRVLDGVPDYAVRRFAITHVPSAAAWLLLRQRAQGWEQRAAPADRLLAVGDPAWRPSADERSVEVRFQDGGVTFVSRPGDIDTLPALTGARTELRRIAHVVGPERSTLLIGADATDTALLGAARPGTRFLHFATHGLTDVKPLLPPEVLRRLDPLAWGRLLQQEPALVLTPDPEHGQDGLLRLDEILGMDLDSDLVVLAGCSTGRGWQRMGSSTYGLGGAFLYAGSRRAIVSQWSVADRQTSQLMVRMYQALERTPDPARALRAAQLLMLGAPDEATAPTHRGFGEITAEPAERPARRSTALPPFFWASFVVVGD